MKEIRESFHSAVNALNKISTVSGSIAELYKMDVKNMDKMSEREVRKELNEALDALELCMQNALKAGEILSDLKAKVYKLLNIDNTIPLEEL